MGNTELRALNTASRNSAVAGPFGLSARLLERVTSLRIQSLRNNLALADKQALIDSISRGSRNVVQISVLGLAAYLVVSKGLQTGAIVASSMLFSRALGPMERLGAGCPTIIGFIRSYQRASILLMSTSLSQAPMKLQPIKGAVELKDVSLVTLPQKRLLLRQISLTLKPNELVIVVGKEAAGKTVLAKIMAGTLRPTSGTVRLDGSNMEDFGREELSDQLGYAPQTIQFASESVAEFISRGLDINPEEVIRAAELACAHETIQRLSNGYNTDLSLDGHSVSAGEKQRIILARAFYKRPPLLILDEPTSHLDDSSERAFLGAIQHLKAEGSTIIVISRLPGLLHNADRLIMLDAGEIRMTADQPEIQSFIAPRLASSRLA